MIELRERADKSVAVGDDLAAHELLAVSFHYPPIASPRAVQVARLLKHLKVKTTLVCADSDDTEHVDPKLVRAAAVVETLKSFLAFLREHKHAAAWGDAEARRGFEAPAVAEKFAGILREVLR